ncbi:MAG: glycosyl transferase family 2 [Rhodobacterales bacterium]|nr:MAG: glycosyl transferase family 2 [Rhodobacterales bacterium]
MRIFIHIGLEHCGAQRLQQVLEDKRGQLAGKGVLFAKSPGGKNHTRLFMAALDPDHIDPLRFVRGFADPGKQAALRSAVMQDLSAEIARVQPQTLILSAVQFSTGLVTDSELQRLHDLLRPLSDDIRIVAHLDEQARVFFQHYAEQILAGRTQPASQELGLAHSKNWREEALKMRHPARPAVNDFPELQAPPFWLDYAALTRHWQSVFGADKVILRSYDPALFASEKVTDEIRQCFDIQDNIGKAQPQTPGAQPSAASLTRGRQMNLAMGKLLQNGMRIPRRLWRQLVRETAIAGPPLDPANFAALSKLFEADNKVLIKQHPGLKADCLMAAPAKEDYIEADPEFGFRASQYLAAFMPRLQRANRDAVAAAKAPAPPDQPLSPSAQKLMGPQALANFNRMKNGPFAPHNRLGRVDERAENPAYEPITPRQLKKGSSGVVVVGCMKNEGPYILEWIAYHRAIGVDNFLIYTNDCSDGTSEILNRLQEMGIVQHRNNDVWKGKSPQQHALNMSLHEDMVKQADWIAHIDVDEFMNIRCGNGTLEDLFERIPQATALAMTWRLFGHNGVQRLDNDRLVIEQFDHAAPKFCPKPHTVWGFKTMFKNDGAYAKYSCHRPNKLFDHARERVNWVNGSGLPMGQEVSEKGWRSSKATIGYDLIQLNHYALRSAESYLIKRQRGRALHVDRSIGINYWVRMDWNDCKDITIQRNIPRTRAEMARLLQDDSLRKWHEKSQRWHLAKAAELHQMPEFSELYQQALEIELTAMERVAYSLALDMES